MKKFIVTGAVKMAPNGFFNNGKMHITNFTIKALDTADISDGNHTFTELYDHRITLFIALCSFARQDQVAEIWRSEMHHDGTGYSGWFILGMWKEPGRQITYHLPMSRWEETDFAETLDRAPEWDGHTPADVLERLKNL